MNIPTGDFVLITTSSFILGGIIFYIITKNMGSATTMSADGDRDPEYEKRESISRDLIDLQDEIYEIMESVNDVSAKESLENAASHIGKMKISAEKGGDISSNGLNAISSLSSAKYVIHGWERNQIEAAETKIRTILSTYKNY